MTVREYHDSISKQLSVLKRLRTRNISAEKYLEPIRQIILSWEGMHTSVTNINPNSSSVVNKIDIVIADLATETGKEVQLRLKLINKLRNLKNLVYPLTLNKEICFSGSGLIIFKEKQPFGLYEYLKNQIQAAKNQLLIIDSYVSEQTLNILYGLPRNILIRILTKKPDPTFIKAWTIFKKEYKNSHSKKHKDVHDRLVIIDQKSFMSGPSLKQAGEKPTLIAHFDTIDSKKAEDFFHWFWNKGKNIL